jgi:hypothetical protein
MVITPQVTLLAVVLKVGSDLTSSQVCPYSEWSLSRGQRDRDWLPPDNWPFSADKTATAEWFPQAVRLDPAIGLDTVLYLPG